MRFADIEKGAIHTSTRTLVFQMLAALAEQEAIREAVPVRSPEPGPTKRDTSLPEQIRYMRRLLARDYPWGADAFFYDKAILASLERLARMEDDGK